MGNAEWGRNINLYHTSLIPHALSLIPESVSSGQKSSQLITENQSNQAPVFPIFVDTYE